MATLTSNAADTFNNTDSTLAAIGAGTGLNPVAAGNYVGEFLGLTNGQAVDQALAAYDALEDKANAVNTSNQADLDAFWQRVNGAYGANAGRYNGALASYLGSDTYQNKDFGYTGNVEDFYDRFANQRADAATRAIANSSAAGGNRFSSDYVNQVAAKQQALASEEWEKAYNKLMQDRQQQLSEYNANSNNAWNNYNATQSKLKAAVDAYGKAQDQLMSGYSDYIGNTIGNRNADLQTQASLTQGRNDAALSRTNGNAATLGLAGNIIGAIL